MSKHAEKVLKTMHSGIISTKRGILPEAIEANYVFLVYKIPKEEKFLQKWSQLTILKPDLELMNRESYTKYLLNTIKHVGEKFGKLYILQYCKFQKGHNSYKIQNWRV